VKTCNVTSNVLRRIAGIIFWTTIAGAGGALGGLLFGLVFGGLEGLMHAGPIALVEIVAYFAASGFAAGVLIGLCGGVMDYESVSEEADFPVAHDSQPTEMMTPLPRTTSSWLPLRNRIAAINETDSLIAAAPDARNPSCN
jgi:hypothetical protein